jgi:phosphoribosylamine-glycine ligase
MTGIQTINKPIAIVLGGTATHIELVMNLKRRGYYVLLIDYLDSPPALKFSDHHIQESTLEKNRVLAIAKEFRAELVVSTSVDQANATAAYVSELLSLPSFYSHQTAITVSDKIRMKHFLKTNNIPSAGFFTLEREEEIHNIGLNYPLVVKPVDTTGSKGVFKIEGDEDFLLKSEESKSFSKSGCLLVEEFVEGEEIQCDFFVIDGIAHFLMDRKKLKPKITENKVLQSVGSVIPSGSFDNVLDQVKTIANKIASSLNIKATPLFIQCIVKNDKVYVLEFALRIGGGLSAALLSLVNGFDFVNASVNALLGKEVDLKYKEFDKMYSSLLIYASEGVFDMVTGLEKVDAHGLAEKTFVLKAVGNKTSSKLMSSDRIVSFIVSGSNLIELNHKKEKILSLIDVLDSNGKSIMVREVYV